MTGWSFHALGLPAAQGSKSYKGMTKGGHAILAESSNKVAPWRDTITSACFGVPKLEGPVGVRIVFTLQRPKGAPKRVVLPCTSRFDLDKLARACLDSVTAAGGWGDDGQVCEVYRLAKVFPGRDFDSEALPVPGVVMAAAQIVPGEDIRSTLWCLMADELKKVWAKVPA